MIDENTNNNNNNAINTSEEKPLNKNDTNPNEETLILLYYYYTPNPPLNIPQQIQFHTELCENNNLKGRIRISSEGINGVLSGKKSCLNNYDKSLKTNLDGGDGIDMKYCHLRKDIDIESQKFHTLNVKETNEVVSLFDPCVPPPNQKKKRNRKKHAKEEKKVDSVVTDAKKDFKEYETGIHLSPSEWHKHLSSNSSESILIDARNIYESKIGYFQAETTPTLLTNTRKYSNLPSVLKESYDKLSGKNVYMYCTGGIRCERASQYLNSLQDDLNNIEPPKQIFQLSGGIQRYLDYMSSATSEKESLFHGKNFVFDPRRVDPQCNDTIVGECIVCNVKHDDYDNGHAPCENKESRCFRCRVLVLVCNDCRGKVCAFGDDAEEGKEFLYCGGDKCVDEGNFLDSVKIL